MMGSACVSHLIWILCYARWTDMWLVLRSPDCDVCRCWRSSWTSARPTSSGPCPARPVWSARASVVSPTSPPDPMETWPCGGSLFSIYRRQLLFPFALVTIDISCHISLSTNELYIYCKNYSLDGFYRRLLNVFDDMQICLGCNIS